MSDLKFNGTKPKEKEPAEKIKDLEARIDKLEEIIKENG